MNQREAFEAYMRESQWNRSAVNLTRSSDGYVGTVAHNNIRSTYASVQMLWESWQAAISYARDEAAKKCLWARNGNTSCADAIKEALK